MSMEEFQKIKDLSAVEKNNLIGKRITAKLRSAQDVIHGECIRFNEKSIILSSGREVMTLGAGTLIRFFD
ncbi:MAG: hypothetical protein UR66_C0005G0081 [Candidatus Moranbacteria bacterium GW2011_GWE1_35_17]|nr:MAG: hypothetical protein UR66_C0005G0081 [Candidatus Moranbacteria bacterium GW2011_GWE1_35_17]